jgi:single-stranded-DNA-specific exonuclease
MAPELALADLDAIPGRSRLLVQLLHNRGIRGASSIGAFLSAGWSAPDDTLPDLAIAIYRIQAAIRAGERIVVFGDFDCDGLTSCALLTAVCAQLGARVVPHVPSREDDGRGLNAAAIRDFAAQGASLIITTDCGTANVAEVELGKTLGIDVVVTDHHPLLGPAAHALALVNPQKADALAAHRDLAGVGVAFRVAEALVRTYGHDLTGLDEGSCAALLEALLDLVAVGTIADIVPLTSENWALAHAGLERLNLRPRPGLRALIARAQLVAGHVVARDISFALAPRLNAGGRLDNPTLALRLLLSADDAEAEELSRELDSMNLRRQALTEALTAEARQQALAQLGRSGTPDGENPTGPLLGSPHLLIALGDDWPQGILGLVAGRLAEEFRRPAFVLSISGDECRGSARAPEGFNLGATLASRADLFHRFGGHAQAAGFALARADVDVLLDHLRATAVMDDNGSVESTRDGDDRERLRIDCRLPLGRLAEDIYADLDRLQPCGPSFSEPVFVSPHVRIVRCWRSGRDGRNLRLVVRDGRSERSVLWPKQGDLSERLRQALPTLPAVDLAYSVAPFYRLDAAEPEWVVRVAALRPSADARGSVTAAP